MKGVGSKTYRFARNALTQENIKWIPALAQIIVHEKDNVQYKISFPTK